MLNVNIHIMYIDTCTNREESKKLCKVQLQSKLFLTIANIGGHWLPVITTQAGL